MEAVQLYGIEDETTEETPQVTVPVMPAAPPWMETPTTRKILTVLQYSHAAGSMSIIYGASGVGKSKTLRYYADRNPNVWIAVLTPARKSTP